MKEVIIIGTGGHARVLVDIIEKSGDKLIGFLDQNRDLGEMILGYPVIGKENDDLKQYLKDNISFVIGVGSNKKRKEIAKKLLVPWYTAIHPKCVLGKNVVVGEGTVIMANSVINPNTVIGKHCIINTAAVIEHDNMIEDYVHISPNVALAGKVYVGEGTHIGIGSSVIDGVSIHNHVTLGAGAVVINNIEKSGVYVGVPARWVKDGNE